MFPFFFMGMLGADWFTKLLNGNSNNTNNTNPNMKYSSHVVSDSLLNVKFGIEENYILKTNAYQDAKLVWTIGIGTVDVFDDKLNFVLKVYKGLTLARLKAVMAKTHLTDLQFCFNLMRNHVRRSKSYQVFKELDGFNIPYNANLADAIIDFNYNSGSAYGTTSYYAFIQTLRQNASMPNNNAQKMAVAYVRYRLAYLESWSPKIYGSWIRRIQIFADRIGKNDLSMDNKKSWKIFPTSVSVKTYVQNTYGYILKKPLG